MEDSENHVEKSNETTDDLSSTSERDAFNYDSFAAGERVSAMWLRLAEQIEGHIPDLLIGEGNPQNAIKWATCAEACYWKATGEALTHDVKDVI